MSSARPQPKVTQMKEDLIKTFCNYVIFSCLHKISKKWNWIFSLIPSHSKFLWKKWQRLFPRDALKIKLKNRENDRERWNATQLFESRPLHVASGFMATMQVLILNQHGCSSATLKGKACTAHLASYLLDLNTYIQHIYTPPYSAHKLFRVPLPSAQSSYKINTEPRCLCKGSLHHFSGPYDAPWFSNYSFSYYSSSRVSKLTSNSLLKTKFTK